MNNKFYWEIKNMYGYIVDDNGKCIISEIHFKNKKEMLAFVSLCLENCIEFGICSYRESDEIIQMHEEVENGMD